MAVNFTNKKVRKPGVADADYQVVTLKRALGRHGVVCRMRSDRHGVRVDLFWIPPRIARHLRPFMSALPLTLMQDLAGKGFAPVDDAPIAGLFGSGIVWASFASGAVEAASAALSVIATHGLANSDRVVAWAPTASESTIRVSRHLADKMIEAAAR